MALSFCAIDFETANTYRGSPCAVGLVRVVNGEIIDRAHWLMRPPKGFDHFDRFNVELHGITQAAVRDQPRFADRLADILDFRQGLPFVAHNAAFDMGVIRDACTASNLPWPNATYACTLVFSRPTWSLLSYSLPWVAEAAGVQLTRHHDAAADAEAAAWIMLAVARITNRHSLDEVAAATNGLIGYMRSDEWQGCHRIWSGNLGDIPGINPNADRAHPLYGRQVVFTGALNSMTRSLAWAKVAEVGGRPAPGVTRDTNVLVIGFQDASRLRPGESLSAKARKVEDLRQKGQNIEIVPENDFLQLLAL